MWTTGEAKVPRVYAHYVYSGCDARFPHGRILLASMVIDIPAEIYEQLEAQNRQAGTTPETLAREFLKTALQAREKPQPRTAHEVLQAAVVFVP